MGKKRTTTTNSQTNTVNSYSRGLIDRATNNVRNTLNSTPYQAFDGPHAAGLSQGQQDAQGLFSQNQGQGQGLINQAAQAAQAAGGYSPQQVDAQSFAGADLSQYQNPYQQDVIDSTVSQINRERDLALNDVKGQATRAGAFGGSRHALVESETARNYADTAARTVAGLNRDSFNTAAGLFNQDANRDLGAQQFNANLGLQGAQLGLQGAGLLGQLGNYTEQNNRADAALLNQFGTQEQAAQQREIDGQYREFLRGQEDPFRRSQIELGLLSGAPVVTNSSGRSTQTSSPGLLGIAGTALQGAALVSDKRLKRDIRKIGTLNGHNFYEYRYTGQEQLTHGVMAQEVMESHPDAVEAIGGYYAVDYSKLEAA